MNHDDRASWPHPGGCVECRRLRVCNVCGERKDRVWSGSCTNGRCRQCHLAVCTSGGEVSPGHGYGTPEAAVNFLEQLRRA